MSDTPNTGKSPRRVVRRATTGAARLRQELAAAQGQLEETRRLAADLQDQYLRLRGDFDAYRQRVARDERRQIERGKRDMLLRLLDVADNLHRALAAVGQADPAVTALFTGFAMIERQLDAALAAEGVLPIAALGEPFDPALHEVLVVDESDAVDREVVSAELGRGYRYGDGVLRPAKVRVTRPAPR